MTPTEQLARKLAEIRKEATPKPCPTCGGFHGDQPDPIKAALCDMVEGYEKLILWLDGQGDEFRGRQDGEGMYWWRVEMMERRSRLLKKLEGE